MAPSVSLKKYKKQTVISIFLTKLPELCRLPVASIYKSEFVDPSTVYANNDVQANHYIVQSTEVHKTKMRNKLQTKSKEDIKQITIKLCNIQLGEFENVIQNRAIRAMYINDDKKK